MTPLLWGKTNSTPGWSPVGFKRRRSFLGIQVDTPFLDSLTIQSPSPATPERARLRSSDPKSHDLKGGHQPAFYRCRRRKNRGLELTLAASPNRSASSPVKPAARTAGSGSIKKLPSSSASRPHGPGCPTSVSTVPFSARRRVARRSPRDSARSPNQTTSWRHSRSRLIHSSSTSAGLP